MKKVLIAVAALAATLILGSGNLYADPLFTDDFASSSSESNWGDESGDWYVGNNVYNATYPSNDPMTYTSLPYNLRNFDITVDMNNAGDGGIWLRSSYDSGNISGVLLVVGGLGSNFIGMYFHIVENGSPAYMSDVFGNFSTGDNLRVTVEVSGNNYTAYAYKGAELVGSMTFTTDQFYSGQVALYDFGPGFTDYDLTFDNVVLNGTPVPVPSALLLLGSGLLGLAAAGRRRLRR